MPELQRAANIAGEENVLDGDALRLVALEQRLEPRVYEQEPFRKGGPRGRGQRAAGDEDVAAARRVDAAIAGALGAGIDPEDSHSVPGGLRPPARGLRHAREA